MKFVILGSGHGSNAEAVLKNWKSGRLEKAEPAGIFSDNPNARILSLGKDYGIPAVHLDPGPYRTKLDPEAERRYVDAIRDLGVQWVVLAGFMRVLKETFLEAFPKRIINLHPSLLPAFKGLDAIRQAHAYGVAITGCSVHLVTNDLDGGPILDQMPVRINPGDSLATVEEAVHSAEHLLLPSVIARLSMGEFAHHV